MLLSCDSAFFNKTKSITFTNIRFQGNIAQAHIIYLDEKAEKKVLPLSDIHKDTITLNIKKNRLTPVLLFSSSVDAEPLGCIYPFSTTLSIHGGFTSWILYRLLIASNNQIDLTHNYLSHFNWERFMQTIQEYENPWILNQDLIIENIADKTFNMYSIKEK